MKQERQKQLGKETRNVQLLRTEREALLEEIEQLRQSMDKPPGEDMERSIVPGTAVLSAEADVLQAQLTEFNTRGQQEQVSLEQQVEELRRQKKEYKRSLPNSILVVSKSRCPLSSKLRSLEDRRRSTSAAYRIQYSWSARAGVP